MYIIQNNQGLECHGEIMCKGKTIEAAVKKFLKENDDYVENGYEVTYDSNYVYIDGEADYKITKV